MAKRLRREEQVERNRERLLEAARSVFVERGFQAATLDAIAEAAGFSKGVVYSQFDSKADLFLALLERRIDERAADNARLAARRGGPAGVMELLSAARSATDAEPAWNLLLLEFRVHAARDPKLNARYAELHARTIERLADALRTAHGRAPGRVTVAPEAMAAFVLAFGAGSVVEGLVSAALPVAQSRAMLARALGVDNGIASAKSRRARPAARPVRGARSARRVP
jgi:AcrR family transcriptional regulator